MNGFIAFILDLIIGDPPYRYHPIRIIGRCITCLEEVLRKLGWDSKGGGVILVMLTLIIVLSGYLSLNTLFSNLNRWLCLSFNLYLCYSCLALGDLLNHIKPVIHSLQNGDLGMTRKSMALIVGRQVQALDEQELGQAARMVRALDEMDAAEGRVGLIYTVSSD